MDILNYYKKQSRITDPGKYQFFYKDLPTDIPSLCQIIHGVILHRMDGSLYQYVVNNDRLTEIDTRFCEKILMKIFSLDKSPLKFQRKLEDRMLGVCRDFSILLCSILRYQNIPARMRFGFSCYHTHNFNHDIVFVEYWHSREKRWRMVDTRTTPEVMEFYRMNNDFSLYDVPLGKLLSAGMAWQLCRKSKIFPEKFGAMLGKNNKGLSYIRDKLLQDVSSLNKKEPLLWDCWGYMLKKEQGMAPTDEKELQLLDELAELTKNSDIDLSRLRKFYKLTAVNMPNIFLSFSPVSGVKEINLIGHC